MNILKDKRVYLTLLCLIFFSILFFTYQKVTDERIKSKNQVLGAKFDARRIDKISKDMQTQEEIVYAFTEWASNPEYFDLYGWDDTTIPNFLIDIAANTKSFIRDAKKMENPGISFVYRIKNLDSLIGKMQIRNRSDKESQFPLVEVYDIVGTRFIARSLGNIELLKKQIESKYKIVKKKDNLTVPRESGYAALHYVIDYNGSLVEVQIKTFGMNFWGEWTHDILYKETNLVISTIGRDKFEELRLYSKKLSEYIRAVERGENVPQPKALQGMEKTLEFIKNPYALEFLNDDGSVNVRKIKNEYEGQQKIKSKNQVLSAIVPRVYPYKGLYVKGAGVCCETKRTSLANN